MFMKWLTGGRIVPMNLGQARLGLGDGRRDLLRPSLLAEVRQKQQRPRQPLLARVEELIDQILLDAAVAGQQIGGEEFAERRFFVKDTGQLGFAHARQATFDHSCGRRQAQGLTNQASFSAEPVPGSR